MPYGITQCYLPPGRGDIPASTPAKAGTRLSDPGGMQGWVDLGGWLEMVYPHNGHPSWTNRAWCWLTSLMRPMTLTTTPSRHLDSLVDSLTITSHQTCQVSCILHVTRAFSVNSPISARPGINYLAHFFSGAVHNFCARFLQQIHKLWTANLGLVLF